MAARMAMMAITTRSSIRVNAREDFMDFSALKFCFRAAKGDHTPSMLKECKRLKVL